MMKNIIMLIALFVTHQLTIGQVTCGDIEASLDVYGLTGETNSMGEEIVSENGGHIVIQFNNSIAPHAFMTYMDNVMYNYPYVSSGDNQNIIRFDISIDDPSDPINIPTESYPWLQFETYLLMNNNIGVYTEGTDLNNSVHNIDYSTYEFSIGENNSIQPRYIRIILKVCGNQVINKTYHQLGMIKYLDAGTISYPEEYAGSAIGFHEISGTPATGGTCGDSYLYRWEKKTQNSSWTSIPDAFSKNYTPTNFFEDTEFRRKVICNGEEMYTASSVLIKYCPGVLLAGEIYCSNIDVDYNKSPGLIEGITPAFGMECDGSYSYEWYKCEGEDSEDWVQIPGAVGESYQVPNLFVTTKFKRRATLPWYGMLKEAFTEEIVINIKRTNAIKSENYIISYAPQEGRELLTEVFSEEIHKLNAGIQYFDGLGRPKQSISIASSPNQKDIVQPIVYDDYGREIQKYLPYEHSNSNNKGQLVGSTLLAEQAAFYNNSNNHVVQDSNPYAQTVFENSPLNRVLAQGAPGADWQPTFDGNGNPTFVGHTTKMDYQTNGANDVRLFNLVNGQLNGSSFYKVGELYKNVIKDENWVDADEKLHTTEEFKDKQGQVVLKRSYVDTSKVLGIKQIATVETYYVYDDYGLLNYVIPPEAVKQMFNTSSPISGYKIIGDDSTLDAAEANVNSYLISNGASLTLKPGFRFTASAGKTLSIATGNVSADLVYAYKYDANARMVEKKIPGAGTVYMVYDNRDRLVATQDAEMRKDGDWLFTKYDAFNHPIITGMYHNTLSREDIQNSVNSYYAANANKYFENRTSTDVDFNYTNQSFPAGIDKKYYLTVTYYDTYGFADGKNFYSTVANDVRGESAYSTMVKGQVTGTRTKVIDGAEFSDQPQWMVATNYYDDKYRLIQSISDLYPANNGNNFMLICNNYDFVGKILNSRTIHAFESTQKSIDERFGYDHAGRLLTHHHHISGQNEVLLVENTYNELGKLATKKVGEAVQQMDYKYNIRGWLTQVNNPDISNPSNKKFAMRLHYNGTLSNLDGVAQYNGNISAMEWRSPSKDDIGMPGDKQAYGFTYDALNRLIASDYGEGSVYTSNGNAYNVSNIKYDLNGNILHLNRQGDIQTSSNSWTQRQIDNLSYSYTGNQLKAVTDAAYSSYTDMHNKKVKDYGFKDGESIAVEYSYDANGNMTADRNKKLKLVEYNYLNLPRKLTGEDNNKIEYIYDANGQKIKKIGTDDTETYYAGGFVYKGTSLQYILNTEGMFQVSSEEGSTTGYQYNLKDHLGNVRLVINANNQVVDQTDYYPFGMNMTPKYAGGLNNLYKYNGKELQDDKLNGEELDWYDYGARFYDPAIARFTGIDPIAEKFYHVTTYNYAENRPISGIDLWGLQYLDHNKARIIAQYKQIRIKTSNLHNVTRNLINQANNNPKNWPKGQIGTSITVGRLDRKTFQAEASKSGRLSNTTSDPTHRDSQIETKGTNRRARRSNDRNGAPVVAGRTSGGKGAAGAVLAVNAINFSLEKLGGFLVQHDLGLIADHSSVDILGAAVENLNSALAAGMIPDKYDNEEGLTNILNVILQGENTTDNDDIMNIGIQILKEIGNNYDPEKIKRKKKE